MKREKEDHYRKGRKLLWVMGKSGCKVFKENAKAANRKEGEAFSSPLPPRPLGLAAGQGGIN